MHSETNAFTFASFGAEAVFQISSMNSADVSYGKNSFHKYKIVQNTDSRLCRDAPINALGQIVILPASNVFRLYILSSFTQFQLLHTIRPYA